MSEILLDIVCCIGLVALALVGILACVALAGCIIKLIKIFKEDA